MKYNELYHHGIKGQKWGVRRYQNKDGSLTSKGKARYGMSKREVKKSIRKVKTNYRKNEDPYHTFSGITGKNMAEVDKNRIHELSNDSEIKK